MWINVCKITISHKFSQEENYSGEIFVQRTTVLCLSMIQMQYGTIQHQKYPLWWLNLSTYLFLGHHLQVQTLSLLLLLPLFLLLPNFQVTIISEVLNQLKQRLAGIGAGPHVDLVAPQPEVSLWKLWILSVTCSEFQLKTLHIKNTHIIWKTNI